VKIFFVRVKFGRKRFGLGNIRINLENRHFEGNFFYCETDRIRKKTA
jgi:hypothetical protein